MYGLNRGNVSVLLLVAIGLSGCGGSTETNEENASNTNGTIPIESADGEQIALERQEAIAQEGLSIEVLSEQANTPITEEERELANRLTQTHKARLAARSAGDYSFETPPAPPISRPGKLLNLPEASGPRFTVTDRQWPASFGDASVSMWSKDKLAAFSLSIDDNHTQDHPFWFEMADEYGWNWTWFVIANQVGYSSRDHWGHWQEALDSGHDIQTHTYSHLCDALFYTHREYRQSQAVINQNLDGAKVVALAYPFGVHSNKAGSPCASLDTDRTANNRDEAAKHFLATRDVYGALSHPARIDYMKVPSVSAARNFFDSSRPWAYFDSVFDSTSSNWRTWYSAHFHGLYNEAQKDAVRDVLAHLKTREDDVWVGTFTAVAKYAQQFATAVLSDIQTTASSISFTLTDQMNDDWFDEPLTVKVRLPDGWTGFTVAASQNSESLPTQVVEYDGANYILVEAIPDRGIVEINF